MVMTIMSVVMRELMVLIEAIATVINALGLYQMAVKMAVLKNTQCLPAPWGKRGRAK